MNEYTAKGKDNKEIITDCYETILSWIWQVNIDMFSRVNAVREEAGKKKLTTREDLWEDNPAVFNI